MDIQQAHNERYTDRTYSAGADHEPRIRLVRALIEGGRGRRILDVGCADGEVLRPFVGCDEIHGLDFTQTFVEQACAVGVRARRCDVANEPFPYPDGSFDVVFTGETIEHLIDTDRFLTEINRVLRPGGRLVLTAPNVRTPVSVAMLVGFGLPPQFSARYRSPHYRDFTLRTLRLALGNNGFDIEQAYGASFFVPGRGECLTRLARWIPSWASQMVVVATRTRPASYDASTTVAPALYR